MNFRELDGAEQRIVIDDSCLSFYRFNLAHYLQPQLAKIVLIQTIF
jgi:hypothetical protein